MTAQAEETRAALLLLHLRPGEGAGARRRAAAKGCTAEGRAVCVTGGISFLGLAVVDHLLRHGYSVRLILETQEDLDKLREMDVFGDNGRYGVWAVRTNAMDLESLYRAFNGCVGVFHTSSLVDLGGISGYTKHMATLEAKAAEQVVEACVRTGSVSKCVFTSSLLACVWRQSYPNRSQSPITIDESCWSDETFSRDNKLWFALGKTMAEKAAWRAARGRDLKLVTVCPALVTGPGFRQQNSTPSIAYLKGAHAMLAEGLLATADVGRVAEAHVRVYEAMGGTAGGRYICYDHVVQRAEELAELERQLGLRPRAAPPFPTRSHGDRAASPSFELCNRKLARLVASWRRCTHDAYDQ